MSLQHVQSGQPLRIAAGDWNKLADSARAYEQNRVNQGASAFRGAGVANRGADIILIKNGSAEDRKRFDVLGIDKPIISQDDNEEEFKRQPALSCVEPTDDHKGKFAVLLEPIAAGDLGRACVSGVTIANVVMANPGDGFADAADGKTTLVSAGTGVAQILWADDSVAANTETLAVIRIGAGAAAGFYAKITSHSFLGDNRWSYGFQAVALQPAGVFQTVPAGTTGTAYNTAESYNAASGILGNGDNTANFPAGIALQPIGPAVVWMRKWPDCNGDSQYLFTAINVSGGAC